MHTPEDWPRLVDLVERVVSEDDLLTSVVAVTRITVREVSALPVSDMTGHTRALLAAATRAVSARRAPTEAELSFVAELAVVRAGQGVPLEAVLAAIHVAERAIWARIRAAARAEGLAAEPLLDARELYDDWADAVRSRLLSAYRNAYADNLRGADTTVALVRRLLEGGSAATLAAAEVGLPSLLWISVNRRRPSPPTPPPPLFAQVDGLDVRIGGGEPRGPVRCAMGVAGPAAPEDLATQRDLAVAALTAAEAIGRTDMVHIADIASLAAVVERPEVAAALLARYRTHLESLRQNTEPVALAVRTWFEVDRDADRAAARLFVHPNTVRNRLQRFTETTGIDPSTPLGAVDAWLLCRTWLAHP